MVISVEKVAVIGAGVAGLQAARHLIAAGFKVIVLEASDDVGGVWRKNYAGYGVQGEVLRSCCSIAHAMLLTLS